jgi:RimJ/RimL family protein N-acetyltransferase
MRTALRGGGLLLRCPEARDAEPIFAAIEESKEALERWMSWYRPGFSLQDARAWIDRCKAEWDGGGDREFGIFDADSGEALGCCGVNQLNRVHAFGNVGYWVRTSRAGHGVATVAVRLLASYAFAELGLKRVEILTLPDNAASRRVAEKAGARYEGIARGRLLYRGTPADAAMHSILPADLDT